jgi:hypothetical protein
MHPYHFVALLGTSPETGWPVLTGRDNNKTMKRESCRNCHIRFRNLLLLHKPATDIKQALDRKEVFNEKTRDNAWSSSWSDSCRAGHSQMEKIVKQSMRIK